MNAAATVAAVATDQLLSMLAVAAVAVSTAAGTAIIPVPEVVESIAIFYR